jgi:hypothetical protein
MDHAPASSRLPAPSPPHSAQDNGFVFFFMRIHKSKWITLETNDRFMVTSDLAREHVLARVDLA